MFCASIRTMVENPLKLPMVEDPLKQARTIKIFLICLLRELVRLEVQGKRWLDLMRQAKRFNRLSTKLSPGDALSWKADPGKRG